MREFAVARKWRDMDVVIFLTGRPPDKRCRAEDVAPCGHDGASKRDAQINGGLSNENTGSSGGSAVNQEMWSHTASGSNKRCCGTSTPANGATWQQLWV